MRIVAVDHAVEVVGRSDAIAQAYAMTTDRGMTTVVGVAKADDMVSLPALSFMVREKAVQGSRLGSGNFRADIPLYCQLYLSGRLMLDELISETIDLSQVTLRLEQLDRSDGARSVILFD